MAGLPSDFWWLPKNTPINKLLVGVGNHRDIVDDEDITPLSSWYHSINKDTLSDKCEYYSIAFIDNWRIICNNTNVYRTLKVFDIKTKEAIFLGPFLVDIDNEEDLGAAQGVAKQVVEYLTTRFKLAISDFRIFFTGHKGFNIEIIPEALSIRGSIFKQTVLSSKELNEIIDALRDLNEVRDEDIYRSREGIVVHLHNDMSLVDNRGTHIDRIYGDRLRYELKHPYIRLHDSINKWIKSNNKIVARKKREVAYQQLCEKPALVISQESEV